MHRCRRAAWSSLELTASTEPRLLICIDCQKPFSFSDDEQRFYQQRGFRIPVRCLLYYMGGEFLGKGTVVNMSRNGMRVLGDHQVVPGMELVLRLSLPDKDEPVEIQRVVVRWVRGLLFGAKIVTLAPDGEERVGSFLSARLRSYCASS